MAARLDRFEWSCVILTFTRAEAIEALAHAASPSLAIFTSQQRRSEVESWEGDEPGPYFGEEPAV